MGDTQNTGGSSSTQRSLNFEALRSHVLSHKIDCALWSIRLLAIFFTFGYLIPIFGNPQNAYMKVLVANAAISALRLHQRLGGRFQLNRQFLAELIMEDSCHYLFYSMIFLYVQPITLVLLPIVLFSVLHASSYSLTLLDTLGQNSWWGARLLISLVEFQSLNILRLVAFSEIILMPYAIIYALLGKAGLLTPFMYYHFLSQRYGSRRNPYTRNMFRELRILFEHTAAKPSMPGIVRTILLGIVNITSKLEPLHQQAAPQSQQQ